MGDDGDGGETDGKRPRHARWRYTAPAVLLLLAAGPAHGYDLLTRLPSVFPRAVEPPDPGTFYRLLRSLEAEAALTSTWQAPGPGPARRIYALTDAGREQLDWWSLQIGREIVALTAFQDAYRQVRPADGEPNPLRDN